MWTYVIFLVITWPGLIIPSIMMGMERFIQTDAWMGSVMIGTGELIFFAYLYQEIKIDNEWIMQRKIGWRGFYNKFVPLQSLTSWMPGHPLRLYSGEKEVMTIGWTTFTKKDSKALHDLLNALDIPKRQV